jgi:hypothetical protein
MAKSKLPPQLVEYWEKKNKKQDEEDSKTPEGKEKIRNRRAQKAVEAAKEYKKTRGQSAEHRQDNKDERGRSEAVRQDEKGRGMRAAKQEARQK